MSSETRSAPYLSQPHDLALPRALTIAGSDSGAGAGIQADLKTFAALGVYGLSALTAVTAQNTQHVRAIQALPPELVEAQIDAVLEDIGADAAKTGMLSNAGVIKAVAQSARKWHLRLVVDPVMVATAGDRLLQAEALETLRDALLPLAEVVTPNLPEAEVLSGQQIETLDEMCAAARAIARLGPRHVVVKGGHRSGAPADVYFNGERCITLPGERIETPHTHGTGCTFSAAIAALLAQGLSVEDALFGAKKYVTEAIRRAPGIGRGHGPIGHLWNMTPPPPMRSSDLVSRLALHVLTDHEWSRGRDLLSVAAAALDGGATVIQLRDKTASTRALIEEGRLLRALTRERGALLIVNDRVDVALAVEADGAHIGPDDLPAALARQLLGPQRILGVSAGSVQEAKESAASGADYLGVGPIYATRTKADAGPAAGTQLLKEIAAQVSTPLVAIGGITPENAAAAIQAGAAGVAVISAVVAADDIAAAAGHLRQAVDVGLRSRKAAGGD